MKTKLTEMFGIEYPIVQSGMQWLAVPQLAAAVCNAGGIGTINVTCWPTLDEFADALDEMNSLTNKPYIVNISLAPTQRLDNEEIRKTIRLCGEKHVAAIETSAEDPREFIADIKSAGMRHFHKCPNYKVSMSMERKGLDGVIIAGYEVGGHPSADGVGTFVIARRCAADMKIPVIAAGGIYTDKSWLPNDGLVNTVSALYPTTTDKNTTECRKQDGSQGWVNYDGYSDIAFRPGIWYVMPVTRADHMQFVGGIANKSIVQTHLFYLDLMDDIYSTYRAVQPGETPFPFTDVPESRWSYPYIRQLYDAGVVSGMTATTFAPAASMTRAEFVTMLAGLQGADVSAYRTGKFTDVPAGAWYAPYVNWAAENGVVHGVSDTAFAPDANISRQDMAVMVYRYAERFGIRLGTDVPPVAFTDAGDIAAYALPAVQALQRAGVISGMPDGSFRPREHMTREQACVVLCAL